jgi:folylpolyglutamate synthase/dihydropteroate synthase
MLDVLAELPCEARVYVRPKGRAAADPAALAARVPGVAAPSLEAALDEARRAAARLASPASAAPANPPLIVVAGSLYLVGEARALLLGLPLDPPVAL